MLQAAMTARISRVELRVSDAVLVVGLTMWALLEFVQHPVGSPIPLLAMTLAVGCRRRLPLVAFCVVGVGLLGLVYEPHPGARAFGPIALVALLVATYSVVTHTRHLASAAVAVAAIAAGAAARAHTPTLPLPAWLLPPLVLGAVWLAALVLRDRAENARHAHREHELERHLALQAERERIARELHDVIGHGVSLMVLQSAAARRLTAANAEERSGLLLGVEQSGRHALDELRRMLALLDGPGDAPLAPAPGIAQLPELIASVRESGLRVELDVHGTPQALAPALELTVYRIVQEALTNSLKHGSGSDTHVRLHYAPDRLHVLVVDADSSAGPATAPAAGRGLLGMRERVSMHGGTLDIGFDDDGAFVVSAHLPYGNEHHAADC